MIKLKSAVAAYFSNFSFAAKQSIHSSQRACFASVATHARRAVAEWCGVVDLFSRWRADETPRDGFSLRPAVFARNRLYQQNRDFDARAAAKQQHSHAMARHPVPRLAY
jgi:hypothetical protein